MKSNHMHDNVWDEIINPFPNFNGTISALILLDMWLLTHAGVTYNPC